MKAWFDGFTNTLKDTAGPSGDLIGAGSASSDEAMGHYRFQHSAKVREVVEECFPRLKELLGADWKKVWSRFWETSPRSPRSLDFYPDVFLEYFLSSPASLELKELARFERFLDTYAWTHVPVLSAPVVEITEDSRIILGESMLISFEVQVVPLYEDDSSNGRSILFWQTELGTRFRALEEWEVEVLSGLDRGIGHALESAPEDPEAVSNFFRWLGSSGLITRVQ